MTTTEKSESGDAQSEPEKPTAKSPEKKPPAKKKPAAKKKPPAKKKEAPAKKKPAVKKKASGGGSVILRKGELLYVDPRKVVVREGWNPRHDYGNMEEFEASILTNGVQKPIEVQRNKKKQLVLVDGERRLRAVLNLIEKNGRKKLPETLRSIPAIEKPADRNDMDTMVSTIISNDGKPFTPLEEAGAYKRLIDMGMSIEDISARVGKAMGTVKNRLLLIDADESVKAALAKGEITLGVAKRVIKASGGDTKKQKKLVAGQKKAKTAKEKKAAKAGLEDERQASEKSKLAPKRARELLFEIASARSKFDRSRKPPGPRNRAYVRLEELERKAVLMKRKGMLRP